MKRRLVVLSLTLVLIVSLIGVLSSCGKGKLDDVLSNLGGDGGTLAAPTGFAYDGSKITWNTVTNATKYEVEVVAGSTTVSKSVGSPMFPYTNSNNETFTVTVRALADDKYDPSEKVTKTVCYLPPVTQFTIEDDCTVVWDAVDGVSAYEVICGDGKTVVTDTRYTIPTTQVGKTFAVTVKPTVQGSDASILYYSANNKTKTITICDTVNADKIKYADGTITWTGVPKANHYEIMIDGRLENDDVRGTAFDYDAHCADFTISIRAIGDHQTSFDGPVSEKEFVYLEAPANIRISDGALVWDSVDKAENYTLKINGADLRKPLTECKYDDLRAGVTTRVQIKANSQSSVYFTSWSNEFSFLILPSPEIQRESTINSLEMAYFVWNSIESATGYAIRIVSPDGQTSVETLSAEANPAYTLDCPDAGEYSFSVKAIANSASGTVCDSAYCAPVSVIRLPAPKASASGFIVSNADSVADGFTVNFVGTSNYATGYELYRENTLTNTTGADSPSFSRVTDFLDDATMAEQILTYKIKAIGSAYNPNSRRVVLNSLDELSFTVTVLAMPANPSISGFILSYDGVNRSNGYTINAGTLPVVSNTTEFDLNGTITNSGTYYVKVNARGNGADVLSSNYTVPITVFKLPAPYDVRISTDTGSEGLLTFEGHNSARSYELTINNEIKEVAASNVENMSSQISTQGTALEIRAVANYYDEQNKIYYMSSDRSTPKTFIKLPIPTFGDAAFSDTQLIWNPINSFPEYSPSYRVVDDSGAAYNGLFNGATMDISYLSGGASYNFRVMAVGDGEKYVNSEYSDVKSIYKLATPNVKISNTLDSYTWRSVANATGYAVYIDGVKSDLQPHNYGDDYTFVPDFNKQKTYQVEVYAIGDLGRTTINSSPCEIAQETKQLDTPDFSYRYTAQTAGEGEIELTVTKEAPYATGYVYSVGNVACKPTTATTYSYDPNATGEFLLSLYAVGGGFDEDGVYYIDSQRCGDNANYKITLLQKPNYNDIVLGRDGVLTWKAVPGATSYAIEYVVNGSDTYTAVVSQGVTLNINDALDDKGVAYSTVNDLAIRITAKGGNEKVVDSQTTEREYNNITH